MIAKRFCRFRNDLELQQAARCFLYRYDYADLEVIEDNNQYIVTANNPHVEYVDLSARNRELRFSTSYKQSLGKWTDAGVGMIYRVHPNNTDVFGNESIFMFKLHHRLGI